MLTEEQNTITQAIIWHFSRGVSNIGSTGPEFYCLGNSENPFLNSNSFLCKSAFNMREETTELGYTDKDYIRFEKLFVSQFENSEYFNNADLNKALEGFSNSISELLKLNPDVLTMELTSEKSVYYTFIKNDFTIFIQHYLDILDFDDDEAILTVFKGDSKLPSFGGNLYEALNELKDVLYPANKVKSWTPQYELSN